MPTEYRSHNLPDELEGAMWELAKLIKPPPGILQDVEALALHAQELQAAHCAVEALVKSLPKRYIACAVLLDGSVLPWHGFHTLKDPSVILEMVTVLTDHSEVSLAAAIQRLAAVGVVLDSVQMSLVRDAQASEARNMVRPRTKSSFSKPPGHTSGPCAKATKESNAKTKLEGLSLAELEEALQLLKQKIGDLK